VKFVNKLILGGVFSATLMSLGVTWVNGSTRSNDTDALSKGDVESEISAVRQPAYDGAIKNIADARALSAPINQTLTVRKGDNLGNILARAGVAPGEAYRAITALSKKFRPRDLKIGQKLKLVLGLSDSGDSVGRYTLSRLSVDPDIRHTVVVVKDSTGALVVKTLKRTILVDATRRGAVIQSSLYLSGQRAQTPPQILARLTHIFSFDVDFQRDVQRGDSFAVLYERLLGEDGGHLGYGEILIAEMTLSGKKIRLFRHQTKDGDTDYYTQKGESVSKALTLTPIDGARISSGYGRRKHPVLGYTKMHRGVDFAAPRGTPVYAGGRGVIEVAGRKGSYGRYIRIRHNSTYKTAYAHLKGFARGIRKGRRVRQGQVIGYVGTSGRSTGPHLHYEIHKNGRQINPRGLNLPSGRKLRGAELAKFQTVRARLENKYAAAPTAVQLASKPVRNSSP
jgi:murein DD-endopeptidase MepM/ murein hydrolase activator NlpD